MVTQDISEHERLDQFTELELLAQISRSGQSARDLHYHFVTDMLYRFVQELQVESLEMFSNPNSKDLLRYLWHRQYVSLEKIFLRPERVRPKGLFSTVIEAGADRAIAIVELPKPIAMNEAYFVGIYYPTKQKVRDSGIRYFTLEYHDPETTALCEWTKNGHKLYGFLGNISKREFRLSVLDIVSR